ncbi:DUF3310 domain-containing protein [Macrococcoides goetzii]|nr:DUF3310 domain-containing protein [Macrococcus goetzii]TDM39868.1 DUF3310 domain-containing protein [Macrococcus goetzii]
MVGRPKKYTKLEEMTIEEIHEKTKDYKAVKKQAEKLGVSLAEWNAFKYKPGNKEKLNELKKAEQKKQSDLELGIEVADAPVIKTIPVEETKTESVIEVSETVDKAQYDELEDRFKELKRCYVAVGEMHEADKKELDKQKKENERLRDQIERLKKNKAEAEEQQKKSTSELNERSRKAENLMRAAETRVAQLQKQVDEQNEIIKKKNETIQFNVSNALKIEEVQTELEQERAEEVASYEQALKQLEQEIQQIGTERDDWKGKYLDLDNAYRALEEESKANVTVINPPSHYAPSGTGTDVIGFLENQFSYEAYKGFMVGNIIKYATRTGRKDEEIQELRKISDYANRMIQHLQQSDVVDAG